MGQSHSQERPPRRRSFSVNDTEYDTEEFRQPQQQPQQQPPQQPQRTNHRATLRSASARRFAADDSEIRRVAPARTSGAAGVVATVRRDPTGSPATATITSTTTTNTTGRHQLHPSHTGHSAETGEPQRSTTRRGLGNAIRAMSSRSFQAVVHRNRNRSDSDGGDHDDDDDDHNDDPNDADNVHNDDEEPPTLVSAMNEPYPSNRLPVQDETDEEDDDFSRHRETCRSVEQRVRQYVTATLNDSQEPTPEDMLYYRRSSTCSASNSSFVSDTYGNDAGDESPRADDEHFYPVASREYEWMGRSIESLLLGHTSAAPMLQLSDAEQQPEDDHLDFFVRRRSTASTFGGPGRRRSSQGASFMHGTRRGSLSLLGPGAGPTPNNMHGGTMASYYTRRRQQHPADVDRSFGDRQGRRSSTSHGPVYRRRSSLASTFSFNQALQQANAAETTNPLRNGGPNVLLNIMARESTGRTCFPRGISTAQSLRLMGGTTLYNHLDKPSAGMVSEVAFLAAAIDSGDWTETHTIISRLVVRIIGDPSVERVGAGVEDANLPPTAPRYYAGGGRLGLERDAFLHAGGVDVMIRMFREKSFVGEDMAASFDARDLSEEIVATRLERCWNETLAALRELVYFIPKLATNGALDDNGDFLPFLFTLLSHDCCFDGAAALIEEILSFMSQTHPSGSTTDSERSSHATTFYLANVPNLYALWRGFNCRQLAHFCRILALLVFEPEDRQLLESPAVLKSLELLQLRRSRASRAGRDSTVDMNQSILMGDEVLIARLLQLLTVMNYAPPLRRFSPYHVMAHYPFIAETLVMLGLVEIENFAEIDRQNRLARALLQTRGERTILCNLGNVANMLEGLSETLQAGNGRQIQGAPNQIGHIIHVITAAQQAGVIVGRDRRGRRRRARDDITDPDDEDSLPVVRIGDAPVDGFAMQSLASVAGILSDQILGNALYRNGGGDDEEPENNSTENSQLFPGGVAIHDSHHEFVHAIHSPEDAANSLQFNAMLLGPYQVEVLFVLCTLLGGRRKLDAQDLLNRLGLVSVLDDMFQRLPWYRPGGHEDRDEQNQSNHSANGIHGAGCECTPESALCVQYLRLLHNFCDRDCDNYVGRRLLLSNRERRELFGNSDDGSTSPGLLSKIIDAFIRESDESPYRFWLASCIESYLRGSSPDEQINAAQSSLLQHLIEDISSERLHCAGSLQTSFDLLGELIKGNADVVRLLTVDLDEESFRKLMSVAAANLVDSNVFIRSLLLSLERFSARLGPYPLYIDTVAFDNNPSRWVSSTGSSSWSYLTHSWWDIPSIHLFDVDDDNTDQYDFDARASDWFPAREIVQITTPTNISEVARIPAGLHQSVGHFGWVFSPAGDSLVPNTYLPNTLERLGWFLAANQARLLRDLLGVVDLRNINHENICCLNTAVVIAIFAHRRKQLAGLLDELRQLNDDEKESKRRAVLKEDDIVDRAFVQAMRYLDLDQQRETPRMHDALLY